MADACADKRVHSEIWYVWCICCGDIARGHAVITRSADAPGKIRGYPTCNKKRRDFFSFASEQPLGSDFESRRLDTHNFGRRLKWDEMKRSRLYYALNSAMKFGFFVFLRNA